MDNHVEFSWAATVNQPWQDAATTLAIDLPQLWKTVLTPVHASFCKALSLTIPNSRFGLLPVMGSVC